MSKIIFTRIINFKSVIGFEIIISKKNTRIFFSCENTKSMVIN